MAALVSSAILSLRLLILAGLLIAPIGAVAYSKVAGYGIGVPASFFSSPFSARR